jgi:hypothetical protein
MTTAKSLAELQADLVELTGERDALRAQLEGLRTWRSRPDRQGTYSGIMR